MDNLEKYIKNNRSSLDKYVPSPDVWVRIRKHTGNRKRILITWLSAAAMITIVSGIGLAVYNLSLRNKLKNISGNPKEQELKETEYFYNTLVNSLYLEAKPMLTSQPEIEKELNIELVKIDEIYSEIKKDLKDNVANQEVIEALIQNYTIKIRLLEDMLSILKEKENNTEKSKSHEL
jgi:hypothetical protein